MFSRSLRAETRSRAKEDLKRVAKTICRVKSWEKKWVPIKDTSMLVYKWVPVSNSDCLSNSNAKRSFLSRSQQPPSLNTVPNSDSIPSMNGNSISTTNDMSKVSSDSQSPEATTKSDANESTESRPNFSQNTPENDQIITSDNNLVNQDESKQTTEKVCTDADKTNGNGVDMQVDQPADSAQGDANEASSNRESQN